MGKTCKNNIKVEIQGPNIHTTVNIIPQEWWQLVQGFRVGSIQKEWDISNPISIGRLATTAWPILTNYVPNGINMQSFDLRT